MSRVISGFPGVGKSSLFRKYGADKVSDSDSSKFPKDKFPTNYLNHIKMLSAAGEKDFILVSSHQNVRDGLEDYGMRFTLVYPDSGIKQEYIDRYIQRGSPPEFVALMESKWDEFLAQCRAQDGCDHIVLQAGQFLEDVI